MDISLLKPLSEILDISIAELLNGKKINNEEKYLKTEEALEKTINYSSKEIKKARKIKRIILNLAIIIIITIIFLFKIFQNKTDYLKQIPEDSKPISIDLSDVSYNLNDIKAGSKINIYVKGESEIFNEPLLKGIDVLAVYNKEESNNDIARIIIVVPKEDYFPISGIFMRKLHQIAITSAPKNMCKENICDINEDLYNYLKEELEYN